jgi:hypothetical protein
MKTKEKHGTLREKRGVKAWLGGMTAALTALTLTFPAFADDTAVTNTYAQKVAAWVLDGAGILFIVGGIVGGGLFALKKNVTGAVITLVLCSLFAFLCYNPGIVKSLGGSIKDILGL